MHASQCTFIRISELKSCSHIVIKDCCVAPDELKYGTHMQVPSAAFAAPEQEELSFSSRAVAAGDGSCEITWPALRAAGAGFWLTEMHAVRYSSQDSIHISEPCATETQPILDSLITWVLFAIIILYLAHY